MQTMERCPVCGGDGLAHVASSRPFALPPEGPQQADLVEVNATRALKGIKPFEEDLCLTMAAFACARYRAEHLREGHTANDFAYLPPGCKADAAGCAAWERGTGWGSCCQDDDYRWAGAAWAMGSDGRRYMHLFVRGKL